MENDKNLVKEFKYSKIGIEELVTIGYLVEQDPALYYQIKGICLKGYARPYSFGDFVPGNNHSVNSNLYLDLMSKNSYKINIMSQDDFRELTDISKIFDSSVHVIDKNCPKQESSETDNSKEELEEEGD